MIDTKEKLAGMLIPAFALKRDGDMGIGDTQAVIEAIDFCARIESAVLQLLPINETGGDNSPYNAISSIALDPVLLTLVPDMVPGLDQPTLQQHAAEKLSQDVVDYNRVKPLKLKLLRAAFENFDRNDISKNSAGAKQFVQFKKEQADWLNGYTLFRTLIDLHNGDARWTLWDQSQRTPKAAEEWVKNYADHQRTREFYAFVQWVADTQWRGVRAHADKRGVRLMGDIPFGVSRYSADVWQHQDLFDLDWSGGAPPETWFQDDLFTAKWGQNWGLPVYKWEAHRQEKFKWWRRRVQKCVEIFNYFRIDHVLGFFRVYSFPWQPEDNGKFLHLSQEEAKKLTGGRLPHFLPRPDDTEEQREGNEAEGRALLQMVMDAAGDSGVVAEDLGSLVPEYVRPTLQELGIPGFTIPYWEKTADNDLKPKETLPELSLATYATHDHQPLVQFYEDMVKRWHGPDGHPHWLEIVKLMHFIGGDEVNPPTKFTPELHHLFMKALLETPCWLAVFMITDLLATTERFNQPGTSGASNWSKRLDFPLSHYEKTAPYSERIADFAHLVKETKRLPQARRVGTIR